MLPAPTASSCPNCAASLAVAPPPRYCPQCGQATELQALSWRDAARESVDRWRRSIVALVAHPGRLTKEHMAGRRQRYVPPLRLYLVASFLFFLVAKVVSGWAGPDTETIRLVDLKGQPIYMKADPAELREARAQLQACVDQPGRCTWFDRASSRIGLMAMEQKAHPEAMAQRFWRLAPNAVFLLLPAFAALAMVAYRSRRLAYGTHLVASLHLHSAWFLLLALLEPFSADVTVNGTVVFGSVYALRAMHVAYGGRWWATALRFLAISLCYSLAFALVMAGLGLATLVTG